MDESYQRATPSGGELPSNGQSAWFQRAPHKLGGFAWSPMAWILLGLFALAEIGNWQMGNEIARVCELLGQGDFAASPPTLAKEEIEGVCRNRAPQSSCQWTRSSVAPQRTGGGFDGHA